MDFNNLDELFNLNVNKNNNKEDVLKKYGRNLTDLAARNELDPVINRDDEIRRMIRILSRKTKNNPVLVGEPGVGKTAIVEGLARKIIEGQVPENLKNKDVVELDLASMIAGASYQGQFEQRIKEVLKRIEESNGEIIVFIDEIHMLVGTGKNADGGMDAANIIKPLMARGKLHLIGATTFDEYRKYIEKDAALERRMQKIDVFEPSVNDTITILRGIKDRFENFHNVKIQDNALISAAKLSARYISDRFLPDKAIDLVDEAAATIKTEINFQPEELEKAKQAIAKLQMEKIALSNESKIKHSERISIINDEIKNLENKVSSLQNRWDNEKQRLNYLSQLRSNLDNLQHALSLAQSESNFEKASKIMYVEIPKLEKEIQLKEEELNSQKNSLIKDSVTPEEIAQIVSKWTNIPVNKLLEAEKEKLLNLETELSNKIKGQEEAIRIVSQSILRSKADINDPNRPLSSFLFIGPTGVGKTELARSLAYSLFDDEKQIIRLDMSEYMEKHSVSKIIGAPPGYIGYDASNSLTDRIRKNPYSILLLDEIEKAHKDVLNILLQILDNGAIHDSKGRLINCRNLIIIMTSNLAASTIIDGKNDNKIKDVLLKHLTPEFLNRIDEIVKFLPLENKAIEEITKLELNKLAKRVNESKNIDLEFSQKVISFISKKAYDQNFGARPIKRYIQNNLEYLLAHQIIEGSLVSEKKYLVDLVAGNFSIVELSK
ncbi:ATP-dependent clp protease, atpase subunit [Mycoplasmopsis columbina SF7]|uniref:ATP-dependent clp protease, atpase subunit n=1 Tax=Mycoplasmopsis columbina SF7 TaxID=1037410 RepID=F9UJF2_9BACT|nr:AAA family ATPase [Mycoplasmopsis columbina]EGV00495.1 ATP-dependent clp protease, atpase subunit [Mycoplasmopsis columbina SF7]